MPARQSSKVMGGRTPARTVMNPEALAKQDAVLHLLARFGEALSSPKRLKIIGLLSQGAKNVDELAEMTGQSMAATSAHLKVLRASQLVDSQKIGRRVRCSLASESVASLWLALRSLGEELLPEVREIVRDYFEYPDLLSPMSMEEVLEEVTADRVILLDLRNAEEFQTGHLPQARHVPVADLAKFLKRLPPGRKVLAYCRGPYCVTSLDGAETLRRRGRPAARLPFGVPEWKAAGLPVEFSQPANPIKP